MDRLNLRLLMEGMEGVLFHVGWLSVRAEGLNLNQNAFHPFHQQPKIQAVHLVIRDIVVCS
jgi:hypothetical protein